MDKARRLRSTFDETPGHPWWRRQIGPLPLWAWGAGGMLVLALIGTAVDGSGAGSQRSAGAAQKSSDPMLTTPALSNSTPELTASPPPTAAPPPPPTSIATPPLPRISNEAMTFLGITGCYPPDAQGWWACTNGTGIALITEASDEVAAFQFVSAQPDFNPFGFTLWSIANGGIVYLPSLDGFDMLLAPAPFPDMTPIDTDCIGVPADPSVCPPA